VSSNALLGTLGANRARFLNRSKSSSDKVSKLKAELAAAEANDREDTVKVHLLHKVLRQRAFSAALSY
jgi:hypothetical protein